MVWGWGEFRGQVRERRVREGGEEGEWERICWGDGGGREDYLSPG